MRKAISPTTAQAKSMTKAGINFPFLWMVVGEFNQKFAVKNIITGEIKVIDKE